MNLTLAQDWIASDRPMALATLVETVGSAPLQPGAMMAVSPDGELEGSVTGGCVEGALAQRLMGMLAAARAATAPTAETVTYGISDSEAADVGLICGGTVSIFCEVLEPGPDRELLARVLGEAAAGRPAAIATRLDPPAAGRRASLDGGGFGDDLLDRNVATAMRGMLAQGATGIRHFGAAGELMGDELRVHIQTFTEPPRLFIIGAIDYSVATARLAAELGYRVTIADPRAPFTASPRYAAAAHEVAVEWPDRFLVAATPGPRDAVLVFTHDPKLDLPALRAALDSGAGYIGALGSRHTQQERLARLRADGADEGQIARIAAPCGLDLGARTPAETAISILAEIIAARNAREAEPLSAGEGPIHPRGGRTSA